MGGPTISLLLRDKLTKEKIDYLRSKLAAYADDKAIGDDNSLSLGGLPFEITFGEQYAGELDERWEDGVSTFLETKPQDMIYIDSYVNARPAHYYFGMLTLALAKELVCIVDWLGDCGLRNRNFSERHPKPIVWFHTYTNGTKNPDGSDMVLYSEFSNVALLEWYMKDTSVDDPPYFLK